MVDKAFRGKTRATLAQQHPLVAAHTPEEKRTRSPNSFRIVQELVHRTHYSSAGSNIR